MPPEQGMPAGLKVGDSVTFEMRARPDHRYQLTGIRKQNAAATAPKPALAPPPQAEPAPSHNQHDPASHAAHDHGAAR
jgi:hypothetical protein